MRSGGSCHLRDKCEHCLSGQIENCMYERGKWSRRLELEAQDPLGRYTPLVGALFKAKKANMPPTTGRARKLIPG